MCSVDVIVPCYRYARFLEACVQSVLAQPVDLRVLIIDDASPDDTAVVAARLARRDSRVQVLTHAANQGHIATFNDGIDWAEAPYTLLISADDQLTPNGLARAVCAMEANPEVGLAYGRVLRFEADDAIPAAQPSGTTCQWQVVCGNDWCETILADPTESLTSPEALVRTCWYKRLGGYRADLPHTHDQEMWLRIAAHSDGAVLDADQAYYRIHSESMHLAYSNRLLVDLEHRDAAVRAFFETCGPRLPDRTRMDFVARRGLGTLALRMACGSFYRGDRDTMRELIRFALATAPELRHSALHLKVRTMGLVGRRGWAALRGATLRPTRPAPKRS
jgi:glycosyltransferase involved in cell wall biosynthesis